MHLAKPNGDGDAASNSPRPRRTVNLIRNENRANTTDTNQVDVETNSTELTNGTARKTRTSANSAESPVTLLPPPRTSRAGTKQFGLVPWLRVVWRPALLDLVESKIFVGLTMLLTIYALVGEDIKLMSTDKDADSTFTSLTIVCMTIFSIECILASIAKVDYFMSFFFWLDIVSTLSMLLDIPAVNEQFLGSDEEVSNVRGSKTARLGARVGRIVRVLRLVRILKLYKAFFDNMQAKKQEKRRKKDLAPGSDDEWAEMEIRTQEHRESKVGMKLSELTIRRVIFLVLFMMLLLPLMSVSEAAQFATSSQFGADLAYAAFAKMAENKTTSAQLADSADKLAYEKALLKNVYFHSWFTRGADECPTTGSFCTRSFTSSIFWIGIAAKNDEILEEKVELAQLRSSTVSTWEMDNIFSDSSAKGSEFGYSFGPMPEIQKTRLGQPWSDYCPYKDSLKRKGISLLSNEISDFNGASVSYVVKCPEDLRRVERAKVYPILNVQQSQHQQWHFAFYLDLRPFVFEEAVFSLLITGFVLLSLMVTSLQFTADANVLVLHPVENMMHKVETIRNNPLMATKVADEEFKVEQITKARQVRMKDRLFKTCTCSSSTEGNNEIMETVILEKTIIKLGTLLALGFGEAGSHIIESNLGDPTGGVNAMVEGTRVECILGTLRIRDFSLATEVLQGRVMTFVNQIAEIVHGVVNEFHGAANKNNGDTYLVVWGLSETQFEVQQRMADMSVVAFARILGAVHRSPVLATYREHPGLQQRLGGQCRVNVTSGVHFGWAIEGAVGSEFKIDASYLSPNVSIAEGIDRATQIYGVSILVSEAVMRMCTPEMAAKGRLIDRVTMTGASSPFNLYVLDMDTRSLTVEAHQRKKNLVWNSRTRFRVRQFLEHEKNDKLQFDLSMAEMFLNDPDIATMRFRYTLEFSQIFNMGYQNYSQGEWQVAKRLLSRTKLMLGTMDGPSAAILDYMEKATVPFQAPDKWQGIRELTEDELA
jgi:class 3 adenylate cyclase